jgi:transcriptional regulator with XRE-family HTH domain
MASSLLECLGRAIRRLRERTGYSQERFASRIGVHRTYMGHLERGTANPTVKMLQLVAEGLSLSVGELLTLAENEGIERAAPLRRVAEPSDRKPAATKRKK